MKHFWIVDAAILANPSNYSDGLRHSFINVNSAEQQVKAIAFLQELYPDSLLWIQTKENHRLVTRLGNKYLHLIGVTNSGYCREVSRLAPKCSQMKESQESNTPVFGMLRENERKMLSGAKSPMTARSWLRDLLGI